MRMVEVDEVPVVLSRSESGEVCYRSGLHPPGGPLAEGEREGDVVPAPGTARCSTCAPERRCGGRRAYRSSASRSGYATAG